MSISVQEITNDSGFKNASKDMNQKDKNAYFHIILSHCNQFSYMPVGENVKFMNILLGYGADGKYRNGSQCVTDKFAKLVEGMSKSENNCG